MRAMAPLRAPQPGLTGKPVLIISGAGSDGAGRQRGARRDLAAAGTAVTHQTLPLGHGLSQMDVDNTRNWMAGLKEMVA